MVGILEVEYQDIERLSDIQLTKLLKKLLYLEAGKSGIKDYQINVSLKINARDGGDDGRIQWNDDVSNTEFIPGKFSIFQCKKREDVAGFDESDCEKELIKSSNSEVLPIIDELFRLNGSYILFFNRACNRGDCQERRIRGLRKGLSNAGADYAESCNILIYDANKIADWTNRYISAILYVLDSVGKNIPINLKLWDEVIFYRKYSNKYFTDEKRSKQILEIKDKSVSKNAIRIYGNSGLGKTRLVLEAFRPPEKVTTAEERVQYEKYQQFVYYNGSDDQKIVPFLSYCRRNGLSGTIVVDECSCELHSKLSDEVKHLDSNLALISIDFVDRCSFYNDGYIFVESLDQESVKEMTKDLFPEFNDDEVAKIVKISDGYPQMAVIIAKDRKEGSKFAGVIDEDKIINRLISGREISSIDQQKVIQACSLFNAFGVKGGVQDQEKFIAKTICHMDYEAFHRILMEIQDRRNIIESKGRFLFISPKPLAITLATRWWKYCLIDVAETILTSDKLDSLQLLNPLCEQFRYLKLEPEIQELTDKLCGFDRHFGQAETLNSERGSRVFRSIAEVNPSAAVYALDRCFGKASKEDLRKVGPGRRNLIWTLENLCFWEEHFQDTAKILLKFAVSETEPGLANNATGIFYQLYYYLLSGTQAPPEKRLEVIDYGLSTGDSDYQRICLNALKNALQTHHFSRMRGVEEQGSRYAEEDWRPKIWQDVYDYWEKSLKILTDYAIQKSQIGDQAKEIIQKSIDELLFKGQLDTIEKSIFKVHNSRQEFWPEILYSLKAFLNRYRDKIPKDAQKRIEGWILEFGPKSFRDELYTIVINPEIWEVHDSENWLEESGIRIKDFAEKIAIDPVELYQNFEYIYSIEGNSLHSFGYYLGEFLPDKQEFINRSIGSLKGIDEDKQNISLLGGFLSALDNQNSKLVSETLDRFGKDHDLKHWLIPLTSRKKVKKEDLERILPYLNGGSIDPVQISVFIYGSVLSELHPRDLTEFLDFILDNFKDSNSLVIEIIHMYTFKDDKKFKECIPFIQKLISQKSLLQLIMQSNNADHYLYGFSEIITKLLNQSKPDINSTKELTYRIIELCRDRDNRDFVGFVYSYGRKILCDILSEKYVKEIWEIFVNAIIDEKQSIYYTLSMLLNKENVGFGIQGNFSIGLIHKIPLEMIEKSCIKYPSLMPYFYAETMTPIIKIVDEEASTEDLTKYKYVWSELANHLLENYGTNEDILNYIDINFGNYSFINSSKEYYEIILSAMLDIKNSKNVCVREWARKNIVLYEQKIKSAESEEQERDLDFLPPPMFY